MTFDRRSKHVEPNPGSSFSPYKNLQPKATARIRTIHRSFPHRCASFGRCRGIRALSTFAIYDTIYRALYTLGTLQLTHDLFFFFFFFFFWASDYFWAA
jgi:hypothetical protein